jgi:hypothetical protein
MAAADGTGSGFVRRKTVTARNDTSMRTVADFGEFGRVILDEPVPHGGTGQGPRRCRRCWARCAGVRR